MAIDARRRQCAHSGGEERNHGTESSGIRVRVDGAIPIQDRSLGARLAGDRENAGIPSCSAFIQHRGAPAVEFNLDHDLVVFRAINLEWSHRVNLPGLHVQQGSGNAVEKDLRARERGGDLAIGIEPRAHARLRSKTKAEDTDDFAGREPTRHRPGGGVCGATEVQRGNCSEICLGENQVFLWEGRIEDRRSVAKIADASIEPERDTVHAT